MHLANPAWLLLGIWIVPIVFNYRRRKTAAGFPSLMIVEKAALRHRAPWRHLGIICRCFALLLLAVALARPQANKGHGPRTSEGLDIVLVIDTSRSMEARDYVLNGQQPTRLEVVKHVIGDFISTRASDRIGMVVFGTEAFTQAPLTLDHGVLDRFLERIEVGMAGDATAIGDGLATAVNRLRPVEAKSKVAILLTDGGNTAGRVDPLAAAEAARTMGVKVYTIGVGSEGEDAKVGSSGGGGQRVDIDEDLLSKIAIDTGGRYFRAADTETLVNVYKTIDTLEKTPSTVTDYAGKEELFHPFAAVAGFFLAAELLLSASRFRRIP